MRAGTYDRWRLVALAVGNNTIAQVRQAIHTSEKEGAII